MQMCLLVTLWLEGGKWLSLAENWTTVSIEDTFHIYFLCGVVRMRHLEGRDWPRAQPTEVPRACWGKPHHPLGRKTALASRRGETGVKGDIRECGGRGKHRCVKERRKKGEQKGWQCVDTRLVYTNLGAKRF